MKKHYQAQGFVLGNLWGGGTGAYPTITVGEPSLEGLQRQAAKYLDDGSLEAGMGFESLVGAVLTVTITEIITLEDGTEPTNPKEYRRRYQADDLVILGDLTEDQQEFLIELVYKNYK